MKIQLLPSVFRKIAVLILAITVLGVLAEHNGVFLNYFKAKHPIDNRAPSFMLPTDYVQFTFVFDQLIPALLVVVVLLLVTSRQKIEDEWIKQKRLVSYKIAFFSLPVLTLLFMKLDPSVIVLSNLVLIGTIQILSFLFMVKIQPHFIDSHEK
jgi:hypothetical protein